MKKFKTKKIKKKKYLKYIFFSFFIFSYSFAIFYFQKNNNKIKNNILDNEFNYFKFNIIKKINKNIDDVIKTPTKFLNTNIKKVTRKNNDQKIKKISIINNTNNKIMNNKEYDPIVYIYNTHNLEAYVDYSVYDASLLLSNILNEYKVDNLLEEQNVSAFLQTNNLKYYEAYNVSRNYLISKKEKYKNLNYFFDIHRDTLSKEKSTINYNGKNYANILFLVGLENNNYEKNLENVNKLNSIVENIIPGISRGIMKKKGEDVNGIYNQDLSENAFLIEIGGLYNTKEEIENTILIVGNMIKEYIKGDI